MAEPEADPVADLLRRAALSDAQRAQLWDLFHAATTEDDLTAKLKPLKIPNPVKADLWDLKAARPSAAAAPSTIAESVANDPTRPRTIWERLTGTTTAIPPDIAAEMQARKTGPPPQHGDVLVENLRGAASYGPAIGGTVGAIYGGPPGAAAGGAIGEAVNLALNPAQRSNTALGMTGQVVGEGALMGATEAALPLVGRGLKAGAQTVYRGYLKPSLAEHLAPRAKQIVETALAEALPIAEAGTKRAQALIDDLNMQVNQMLARQGGKIDLHAIANRVRDFAKRKYFAPGRPAENYEAALKVADTIDQHASLGLPPGARPTRVDVDLPTANVVKGNLRETAGEDAFGVATGVARKETAKAGGHELRVALEQATPNPLKPGESLIGPLNARESKLIDAAEAIARAVNREANQNALVGVKSIVAGAVAGEEYARTGDPVLAAIKAVALRQALTPAVASKAAIIAYRLSQMNRLAPTAAVRIAMQALQNTGTESNAVAPAQ